MKSKPNTKVAVTYEACAYNAVLAQYTDFTLTESTLSEKFSNPQILQHLVDFFNVLELPLFFITTLTPQLFLSVSQCLMMSVTVAEILTVISI